MIWTAVLSALARLLGRLLPFLAVWGATRRNDNLRDQNEALAAEAKTQSDMREIEHEVRTLGDDDLADRITRGVREKRR